MNKKVESKVIVLRSCKMDGTSHGGFAWPAEPGSVVEAPDWKPTTECGNGLHGLLPGQNDPGVWHDGLVQFVAVDTADIVDLGGKVKFPKCIVLYTGAPADAWAWAHLHAPGAWFHGTATAGCGGTATAGHYGTATAGYHGTATAGDYGTATAGCGGTATAGHYGTATAGHYGTATAGCGGTICIKRWDGNRFRLVVGYIGEAGLLPNVAYKLGEKGKFVKAGS